MKKLKAVVGKCYKTAFLTEYTKSPQSAKGTEEMPQITEANNLEYRH